MSPPQQPGLTVLPFTSTADLQALLGAHFPACEVLVMAAAVADYTPKQRIAGKTERGKGLTLELVPTPDLVAGLAAVKREGQLVVAFALEDPAHLERRALEKMRRKGVDAIVANPLVTMDADTIEPTFFTAGGERFSPGAMTKADFAPWLLERVDALG